MSLLLDLVLIVHCLQECPAMSRIDPVSLRQCPLTPSFELASHGKSITCLGQSDSFNVLPYLSGLLECCCVPEKTINPGLFNSLQPFFLGAFNGKFPLPFFLFELRSSLNTQLILLDSHLAVLDLCCQDHFDCNLRHTRFELAFIIILPSHSVRF
jgi:hypothetical protein